MENIKWLNGNADMHADMLANRYETNMNKKYEEQ